MAGEFGDGAHRCDRFVVETSGEIMGRPVHPVADLPEPVADPAGRRELECRCRNLSRGYAIYTILLDLG